MRRVLGSLAPPDVDSSAGQTSSKAVADGEQAIAAVRRRQPDLLITPNLDGVGVLRALRANDATKDIPVIALSARAGEEARVEGLRAGFSDYVVKPFSARELVVRVEAQLARVELRAVAELHSRRWQTCSRTRLSE